MAEITPTEADASNSSSIAKQLLNVLWNRGGIEVPSYVGLGVSKYRRHRSTTPTYNYASEHQVYSPRPVFTRAGTTTALHGTEVYFSVSSHGYDCPSPVLDNPTRMPHYVWKYNCVEEECSDLLLRNICVFTILVLQLLMSNW